MNDDLNLPQNQIEHLIYYIRGVYVMFDRDLAEIYQVETKVLNQAVKRNIARFPDIFRFQITDEELFDITSNSDRSSSRSQFVTLNKKRGKNIKYLPHVFTEQGVAMLSAILRSDVAIQVSIQIINAFIEMRKTINHHQGLLQRVENIERKILKSDDKIEHILNAIENKESIPSQGVFFEGQVFDAYLFATKIIRSAKKSIVLIDNYIDETTLVHLSKKEKSVKVLLLCKNQSKQLDLDVQKSNAQYGNFEIKNFIESHDRFLIIDSMEIYHLGSSLKDLGKKWFAFSKMDKNSVESIMNKISL